MTNYYIKNGGNDSNTGLSDAQAWETISEVNSHNFLIGDNIFFKCGNSWGQQRLAVDWAGTEADPAVIGAYYMDGATEIVGVNGDGKPIIQGTLVDEINKYPSTNYGLIDVRNSEDWVTVQDLKVIDSGGYGIAFLTDSDHCIVKRCDIDHCYQNSILFYNNDYGIAEYNTVSRSGKARIIDQPTYWPGGIGLPHIARYNTIHSTWGEGINCDNGSIVMYNLVYDTMSVGIYMNGKSNAEVAYNMIVGTNDTTYTTFDWHGMGIGATIEAGSYNNCTNNKIHNNIVINTAAGIRMYNNSTATPKKILDNIYIYNNLFIDNKNTFHVGMSEGIGNNINIKNNIIYTPHADAKYILTYGDPINNWDIDYNLWNGNTSPTGIWLGAHDQIGDPNFQKSVWKSPSFDMNDFTTLDCVPQAGSPATDNGANLSSPYNMGLNKNSTWPNSVSTLDQNSYGTDWDIGAFVCNGLLPYSRFRGINKPKPYYNMTMGKFK